MGGAWPAACQTFPKGKQRPARTTLVQVSRAAEIGRAAIVWRVEACAVRAAWCALETVCGAHSALQTVCSAKCVLHNAHCPTHIHCTQSALQTARQTVSGAQTKH